MGVVEKRGEGMAAPPPGLTAAPSAVETTPRPIPNSGNDHDVARSPAGGNGNGRPQ